MAESWVNGVQSQKVMTSECFLPRERRRDIDLPSAQTYVLSFPLNPLHIFSHALLDFVANEQEYHRRSNNSVIDLRTLHEIYLEPFRLQCRANPVAYVSHVDVPLITGHGD